MSVLAHTKGLSRAGGGTSAHFAAEALERRTLLAAALSYTNEELVRAIEDHTR